MVHTRNSVVYISPYVYPGTLRKVINLESKIIEKVGYILSGGLVRLEMQNKITIEAPNI